MKIYPILALTLALMFLGLIAVAAVGFIAQRFSVDEALTVVFVSCAIIIYGFIYAGMSLANNNKEI